MTAGEPLQEQRPHSIERTRSRKKKHDEQQYEHKKTVNISSDRAQASRQLDVYTLHLWVEVAAAAASTCWQGSDCRNNAHKVMNILNKILKNILVHKFRIRMKRQVLSCSIPAATRARSRTTKTKRA